MLNQELNGLSQLQSPEEKIITEVVFCITQKEKHLNIYKYDPNSWKTGILVSCSSVTKKDGCHGVSLCYDVSLWYVLTHVMVLVCDMSLLSWKNQNTEYIPPNAKYQKYLRRSSAPNEQSTIQLMPEKCRCGNISNAIVTFKILFRRNISLSRKLSNMQQSMYQGWDIIHQNLHSITWRHSRKIEVHFMNILSACFFN